MTCGAEMYYTTTRSELVKTGNVHAGHHTSVGCQVDVKVCVSVSLNGSKSKEKSGCQCGETPVVCSR